VCRLTPWLSVAAGGIALYRLLARRPAPAPALPPAAPPAPDPRAEELRAKLEQQEVAPPVEAEPEPPAEDVPVDADERRRRIHERARAAAEEMRRTGGP